MYHTHHVHCPEVLSGGKEYRDPFGQGLPPENAYRGQERNNSADNPLLTAGTFRLPYVHLCTVRSTVQDMGLRFPPHNKMVPAGIHEIQGLQGIQGFLRPVLYLRTDYSSAFHDHFVSGRKEKLQSQGIYRGSLDAGHGGSRYCSRYRIYPRFLSRCVPYRFPAGALRHRHDPGHRIYRAKPADRNSKRYLSSPPDRQEH